MTPGLRRLVVPLVVAGVFATAPSSPLRINLSPSLPRGLYLTSDEAPRRGTLALACLPSEIAEFGLRRGYLQPGTCPSGTAPVLKWLAAARGDRVALTASGVYVNGLRLPFSSPRPEDRSGRELEPVSLGVRALESEYWLHAPRLDSWDSRYYGPVPASAVLTTLRPLLTWPPSSISAR